MSDVTAPPSPTDAAPAAAPWPYPRRLLAVFTQPRALFEHLAGRPTWLVPLVLLVVSALAFVLLAWEKSFLPMILEQMEGQDSPPQAFEFMENNGKAFYSFLVPFAVAASQFVCALVIMFVASFLLGGRTSYRQALSILTHASQVSLLAFPIRLLLAFLSGNAQVTLGPGALLPLMEQEGFGMKFLASFLQTFDVFNLWTWALVGLGISIIGRIPQRTALIAAFGIMLAFGAVTALTQSMGGG